MLSALLLAAATADASGWEISRNTEALTGATTVTATLDSDGTVSNMIGVQEKATIVLRCKEGNLAAYVAWPQVLSSEFGPYGGATVRWRADDQPIQTEEWQISDDGTAVGRFQTNRSAELLAKLAPAHRFAIRLTGSTTEDAAFSLGDLAPVLKEVQEQCPLPRRK